MLEPATLAWYKRNMGLYDTVRFNCPRCQAEMYTQTKAGDCLMWSYRLENAPPAVQLDVCGYPPERCSGCGAMVDLVVHEGRPVARVAS